MPYKYIILSYTVEGELEQMVFTKPDSELYDAIENCFLGKKATIEKVFNEIYHDFMYSGVCPTVTNRISSIMYVTYVK